MSNFYTIKDAIEELKSTEEGPFRGLAYYRDREIFWSNVDFVLIVILVLAAVGGFKLWAVLF